MSTKSNQSLEQQMQQLDELLQWFDQDDFDLEQAVAKYKQAEEITGQIRQRLSELKNEITVLKESFDKES